MPARDAGWSITTEIHDIVANDEHVVALVTAHATARTGRRSTTAPPRSCMCATARSPSAGRSRTTRRRSSTSSPRTRPEPNGRPRWPPSPCLALVRRVQGGGKDHLDRVVVEVSHQLPGDETQGYCARRVDPRRNSSCSRGGRSSSATSCSAIGAVRTSRSRCPPGRSGHRGSRSRSSRFRPSPSGSCPSS